MKGKGLTPGGKGAVALPSDSNGCQIDFPFAPTSILSTLTSSTGGFAADAEGWGTPARSWGLGPHPQMGTAMAAARTPEHLMLTMVTTYTEPGNVPP